jgi:hypothetical protein
MSVTAERLAYMKDPFVLAGLLWPDVTFYDKQREIIKSVWENDETFVPAGNMLGKDFVAGFIALAFFLTRHPCRIITTSVDHTQLESVLWGEIRRFIQTSRIPLEDSEGGPLHVNHLQIRKVVRGQEDGLSYLRGRVAAKGEGMLGHHIAKVGDGIPRTLFMADEASGVDDVSHERADTWADRKLAIGNCYPCSNFFFRGVQGGDLPAPDHMEDRPHYYRKVIRIRAEDSPNVRYNIAKQKVGQLQFPAEVKLPGVLPYDDYLKRRSTWDEIRQCIGLDAKFWDGPEGLLFPPEWLNRAERLADQLKHVPRKARAIGIDPAEGGAKTAMAVVDDLGLIELISEKTRDTSFIYRRCLNLMRKHNVPASNVIFDRGGGGKQIADFLRFHGHNVRTVGFGEPIVPDPRRGMVFTRQRVDEREEKYAYVNRRAEIYGMLRQLLDPNGLDHTTGKPQKGFAIPAEFSELRRQLAPIPLTFDQEGRMYLLPKHKKNKDDTRETLTDLIGHSPDEADALVLAIYGMTFKARRIVAGPL